MELILSTLINGLSLGGIYAMIALGYTIENAVTGESITWEATGYVNKIAIQYVIKEAN